MTRPPHRAWTLEHFAVATVAAIAAVACNDAGPDPAALGESAPQPVAESSRSADARLDFIRNQLEDQQAPRHDSDGGGRAWLVVPDGRERPPQVEVGSRVRFEIIYEVGPLGIAEGGAIYFLGSPFWGWDEIQGTAPGAPGFTRAETDATGVKLSGQSGGKHLYAFEIGGRSLEAGERVRIFYGAGPALARVDRWAERESRLWLAVDGDGDGIRSLVAESPSVEIVAGPPARLVATLSTTARPGDPVRLTLAVLDAEANAGFPFEGRVELSVPDGLELAPHLDLKASDRGRKTIEGTARRAGVFRVRAVADPELGTESNPLIVRDDAPGLLWGDLHGHSSLSDGSGTPDQYFVYARDVAALDVVALTDHDHWGLRFLDQNPDLWQRIQDATQRFHRPGRFVTIPGYEWTSWLHGHKHVLTFAGEARLASWMDPRTATPELLWKSLEGRDVLTFAHHSAGGPISTNWDFTPDPVLEPVTEIVSSHGSSEAADSPGAIYKPVPGNYVRDVLDRGVRFGFIGSGDSHNGHPGLVQLHQDRGIGGLAAILTDDFTRMGVLRALRERRVYATSGPRIFLRVRLDDAPMGSVSTAAPDSVASQQLSFEATTPAPIVRIDVIRSGSVVARIPGKARRRLSGKRRIARLAAGDYLYLRLIQDDGGMAWSSPIYAR